MLAAARDEADASLDSAREEAARCVEEAKVEARRAGEAERVQVEGEVQALLARRDFLESDVDHLEQYLVAQRERITEAVAELDRARASGCPSGLADMRRPLLSAAADDGDAGDRRTAEPADAELAEIDDAPSTPTSRRGGAPAIAEIDEVAEPPTAGDADARRRRRRCDRGRRADRQPTRPRDR